VEQHLPAVGNYRGRLSVNLMHYVILGAVSLQPGAVFQNGGYRIVVDRTTWIDNNLAVVAREARATSMWERRPWAHYHFYLRNPRRSEALDVDDHTFQGRFPLLAFLPVGEVSVGSAQSSGFSSRGMVLRVPQRYAPDAQTLDIDEAWLADAELVIVRQTQEGWVDRTLEIPDFPIGQ
jgi:hypothetical protein